MKKMQVKREIVPKDSGYIPFSQQPYCCVPASIQMVMYRHGIPLIPAEELGYHLGLTVPPDAAEFFWKPRISKIPPISGYGTQIYEGKYEPNKVFKKLGIPLKMDLRSIESFKNFGDFKNYLFHLSKKDFDVLLCFHHGTLVDDPTKDHGHVTVLDAVYPSQKEIRFIDPARAPKWRVFSMKEMYEAMKAHANGKAAGFWELYHVQEK